jgi:predicted amidohydrolase
LDVALVQAQPELGDVKANIAQVVDALQREAADLVVFPELFLTGYLMRDALHNLALDPDGPEIGELVDACRTTGKRLIVGAPMQSRVRGSTTNSALLIGPEGIEGRYDKRYLPTFSVFEEDTYFCEGTGGPVFTVPTPDGGEVRVGVNICYDLFFPEITKAQALAGADVLVCISASPSISRKYFEVLFQARAVETTSYVLYTNLVGPMDTLQFWGGAQAYSPLGKFLDKGPIDEPGSITVAVDEAEVREALRRRPVLRDTRLEVLDDLVRARRGE